MKFIYCCVFLFTVCFMPQKKKRVIFFGDSITQQGVEPGGYITRIDSMCKLENRSSEFEFIGSGVGGNKVYDLYLRLDDDVLAKNPDIVAIYIGVNDVWHKASFGTGTDPDKFEKFYTAILKKLKEKSIRVILCTPAVIGERTDFSNQQDGDMNRYSGIIRSIAQKNNLPLVDLRQKFLEYNKQYNTENKESGVLTRDRVHLNEKGNQLVADEMWRVIKSL
ncbi:MAG: G-D-S-L family lipolytic protein [Bacteroidetes bacterium]|nr:MAG: G-D-S-L family lipolytic protein [Bacteroidota bacterium]